MFWRFEIVWGTKLVMPPAAPFLYRQKRGKERPKAVLLETPHVYLAVQD